MPEPLIIEPEALAKAAGIPLPLDDAQTETITEAILDAQADVVAFLGQPITPETFVQTDCYPYGDAWVLTAHGDTDIVDIVSVAPQTAGGQPTGYFTVTYTAGLDAANDPALRPIRRYVKAHALNSPEFVRTWKDATGAQGEVRSVTASGQSITLSGATLGGGGGKPGSGEPGALPVLGSLDRWRVAGRRVYQARTRFTEYPYQSTLP